MSGTLRPLAERAVDQLGDLFVADPARGSGARLVEQPVHALTGEALAPLADRMLADGEVCRDGSVAQAVSGQRHDPGPQGRALSGFAAASQALDLASLSLA
ncbi:hypothetical protein SQ03_13130 [Methylobacterium platani JCM 14648]|uniref:Uncharacterized protein n=2 Tax=Methylobacterium platani TaxID=427683 RepID=A0A179SFS3_9HYPH|nr:hypothetical protein SQ03_13130 [Methylobacterium platani JCM 14648]OAS25804.1 hypothetical protein A5481_08190 [Methylobacterium platani]